MLKKLGNMSFEMKKQGKDLQFISRISRDGSGTVKLNSKHEYLVRDTEFDLTPLSLTEGTYIASGFNCYVVRLKKEEKMTKLTDKELINKILTEIEKYSDGKQLEFDTDEIERVCGLALKAINLEESIKYLHKEEINRISDMMGKLYDNINKT